MADFTITKNQDFSYNIKVIEKDSFLAQDLTNMDTATLTVFQIVDQCFMFSDDLLVTDALNGLLAGHMPASDTNLLSIDRGNKEDGYYLKAPYQASITITFTDATLPISVIVERIFVAPTGVTCA